MPLPGNKASTPFKTMDIKAALLSAGNRKRKIPSPQVCKNEPKSLKSVAERSDKEIEILDEACRITVTLEQSKHDSSLGDCKENKDINTTKMQSVVDNKQSPSKDELFLNIDKTSSKSPKLANPKSPCSLVNSDNDIKLLSENTKICDNSNYELNSSVNVLFNTTGRLSVTVEDKTADEKETANPKYIDCTKNADEKAGEKDIKMEDSSCSNRKRKAPSPQVGKNKQKSLKLSVENSDSEFSEFLENTCGITVTIEQSKLDPVPGDEDINILNANSLNTNCKNNLLKDNAKDTLKSTTQKSSRSQVNSDCDVELTESSKISENSSCDEHNDSVNVSLNTSGLSVTADDDKVSIPKSKSDECSGNANEKSPKIKDKERVKKKKMTPAEAQKKAEERELLKKERELKRQEIESKKRERLLEKERRIREKTLQKEREELERKERERIKQEKKEQEEKERMQRQKEKEEKLKMKQIISEQKLEEKRKKEEMRQKREEELKKAEEEKTRAKLEKEQKEKEKKERAKAAFAKFFLKGGTNPSAVPVQSAEKEGAFLPFQVSDDMILAPVVPPAVQERFDKKQLDDYLEHQDDKKSYLEILKSGSYKDIRQRKKNRKLRASDADVIIIDNNAQNQIGLCPKLLQFCENVRPPYWGTWRKKSKNIGPRNPFGQDEVFDYSVDSDDEWDEGGPGESLSGTEQEDVESEDEYEVDNEFFVPHGYLSDEEEKKEDDDEEVNDPERQKALLKLKLQEFEMERKKKTTELKPIILGCYFANHPSFQDSGLQMFLETYSAELLSETPIQTSFTLKNQQADCSNNKSESPKSSKKKKLLVPDKAFPQLIRLIHGNTKNRRVLAEEFQKFWEQSGESQEVKLEADKLPPNVDTEPTKEEVSDIPNDSSLISLRQLNQAIREIATYCKPPDSAFNKYCWWVHDAIREKYGLLDAPIPNEWKYVSQKPPEPNVKVNSTSIKEFLSPN